MATALTGQPAAGIAASVITGYATQMAVNKLAKEEDINGSSGSGLFAGGQIAAGLYAGSQGRGMDSDSEDECCSMCGQGLFIDKKFSIRNVYDAAKSIPKQVNKNVRSLKSGKKTEDMEGGMMGSDPITYSPRGRGMPMQSNEILNGIVAPKIGGRGVKSSPEMKKKMKKLRKMRKKK